MRLFIYIGFIKKILSYRFVLYFEIIHFFVSKQFNSKLIKFVNLPKVLMYRISTVSKSCASLLIVQGSWTMLILFESGESIQAIAIDKYILIRPFFRFSLSTIQSVLTCSDRNTTNHVLQYSKILLDFFRKVIVLSTRFCSYMCMFTSHESYFIRYIM